VCVPRNESKQSRPTDTVSGAPSDTVFDLLSVGELIPLSEAAKIAGLSHESLQKYAVLGKLAAKKVGRDWLTTDAAVRAYLERRWTERKPHQRRSTS
jgi:hypothetical protein